MKTPLMQTASSARRTPARQRGTTLIELMIALALLFVVAGAAFRLFNMQQVSTSNLQGQVGLSLSLRNAASQLQLDLANAGSGYFQGINVPSWPVGVTIVNNWVPYGSSCYNKNNNPPYSASCFDQVNIITADPVKYPAVHATNSAGSLATNACSQTSAGSPNINNTPGATITVYAQPASGLNAAQTAANFVAGDQLLFLTGALPMQMTTATLAANGTYSGSVVALTIYQTLPDGSNVTIPPNALPGTWSNDPLDITSCDRNPSTNPILTVGSAGPPVVQSTPLCPPTPTSVTQKGLSTTAPSPTFGINYCSADWIIKLSPITYSVQSNNADPNNPWQLVRKQNNVSSVVMDQIIGFKVGAALWDNDQLCGYTTPCYNYQASTYAIGAAAPNSSGWNFSLIRAVRVSLIARTTPNYSQQYVFKNTFDQGPYQVQGTAIVVNPRNLSMSDDKVPGYPAPPP